MRVYEIAKEVGIPNKDLIAKIRALGLEVNNHMSSLDADDVARIKRSLEKEKASVVQPQQTQRLSTGTVLRRRSSGDKADGSDRTGEERPVERPSAPERPVVARSGTSAASTTGNDRTVVARENGVERTGERAPVVRRRVEERVEEPAPPTPVKPA